MDDVILIEWPVDGELSVVEVENSYRGMEAVIGRMTAPMRRISIGHGALESEPFDGVLFDEYREWSEFYTMSRPRLLFLSRNGEIFMVGTGIDQMSLPVFEGDGRMRLVDISTCSEVAKEQAVHVTSKLIELAGRYEGPTWLTDDDADWIMDGAPEEDRIRVAHSIAGMHVGRCEKIRKFLAHDESPMVRMCSALNPSVEPWMLHDLSKDPDWHVRQAVARAPAFSHSSLMGVSVLVSRLLDDPEFEVRMRMAAVMINTARMNVIPCFDRSKRIRMLMECKDERIRSYAAMSLMEDNGWN